MDKQEMIEAIRRSNPTADAAFLSAFDLRDLERYLRRLTRVQGRRGPGSRWVRESDSCAVVSRGPDAGRLFAGA